MKLHLTTPGPRAWHHVGAVHARGLAFTPAGDYVEGAALAAHLDGPADSFVERVAALDGTFAAVHVGDTTTAAVDRIRSLPLFYGRDRMGTWHLSDDARRIADLTNARLDDATAAAEFMIQNATTGPTTLSSSIRQVQAGEAVTIGAAEPTDTRYYRYGAAPLIDASEDALIEEGVRLFEQAFERFLVSVRGRSIVLPLSGGADSRLLATMIARGGRTDALCFCYGRESSFETRASRRVAEALGLPWTFVPYSNRQWHHWAASEAYQDYRRVATGLTGIEHEQDWPAVLTLKERGLPDDAVFIPGHSGNFLSGTLYQPTPAPYEDDPVEWLWRRYYGDWPTEALAPDLVAELRARIAKRIDGMATPLEAFSHFGWQERQAKMIVNSIRVYEHHGFDWRLPLWLDGDVFDFWSRIPVPLRRGRRLYKHVLRRLLGDDLFDLPSTLRRDLPLAGKLRRLLDPNLGRYGIWLGPYPMLSAVRTRVGDVARIEHSVVGPVVEQCARPIANRPLPWATINGLLALDQLRDLSRELG